MQFYNILGGLVDRKSKQLPLASSSLKGFMQWFPLFGLKVIRHERIDLLWTYSNEWSETASRLIGFEISLKWPQETSISTSYAKRPLLIWVISSKEVGA